MFHYQVGSLEEEPVVLARYLAGRARQLVAVAHDHSPVGRRYAEFFAEAVGALGIDITGVAAVAPLAEDVSPVVARLRAGAPDGLVYLGLGVAARAVALAVESEKWDVPVVANSSLMFGYARRDWRAGWEGWVYVDSVSDDNRSGAALRERTPPQRGRAHRGGRLRHRPARGRGRGPCRPPDPGRDQRRPRERQAATGLERHGGHHHGVRHYDHGALKGRYLVLRQWLDGKTVQVADQ